MRRIHFLIVGAQKAGTTALDHYLRQHPEIGMATKKEVHFFDLETKNPFKKRYSSYHKHFDFRSNKKVYGESTPIYSYWQPCCINIKRYNPKMKLIAILRDPIQRAFSHWKMEVGRGNENISFSQRIRNEKINPPIQNRVFSYVDRGFYAIQIKRLRTHFPEQQLLFIKYEDFKSNQLATLHQIFSFLGVEKEKYQYVYTQKRRSDSLEQLLESDKIFLRSIYKKEVQEVEQLLQWDCKDWLR